MKGRADFLVRRAGWKARCYEVRVTNRGDFFMNTIHHRKSESGQAIVLLVFGMIVLMGMAGLAIDGGNLYAQKRRGQAAVDNAALAYALELSQGTGSSFGQTRATTVLSSNGYVNGEDFLFLQYYQMERLVTFLLPDPSVQHGASYNVNQALISIGSGGLFGQGYGHGTQVQLRFLKVRHTDFIFSAMAEEFGFAGALIFLITLIFVILRCLRAARRARDTFGALICYSVAILLLFQGAFNVGMNLNMFPVSGLPLPFLSYGGSSLLASLFGVGLVESVNLRHKQIEL